MDAYKITTFGPDAEGFGVVFQSSKLAFLPVDEPSQDIPQHTDIMAQFTHLLSAALDEYARKYEAELSAKDKQIAALSRKVKDADDALKREVQARTNAEDVSQSLLLVLDATENVVKELTQKNIDLIIGLAEAREAHAAEKGALEEQVKDLGEQVSALRHDADLQGRRNAHTRNVAARAEGLLLQVKAYRNMSKQRNAVIREEYAMLDQENQALRVDRVQLKAANALAQHKIRCLRAHASVESRTASQDPLVAEVPQVLSATAPSTVMDVAKVPSLVVVAQKPARVAAPSSSSSPPSSFGYGMFGNVASSTVFAITSTQRSLLKVVMGISPA